MSAYETLKKVWKKLGIKAHVLNFSSQPLWVLETDSNVPIAHYLPSMTRSPPRVDADAFRRVDGKSIEGHRSWWKIYDGFNVEVFDGKKKATIEVSAIPKTAVTDREFTQDQIIYDEAKIWAVPIRILTNVKRHKKTRKITHYHISGLGWIDPDTALEMTCQHQIANARPVFPQGGQPYIRTRRDPELFNNIEVFG